MRKIDYIVVHCTATPQTTTVESILNFWRTPPPKGNGWKSPGYHYIILANGAVRSLLPIEQPSNGVAGHNYNSVHVSYIGGADGVDTRTPAQKESLIKILKDLKRKFPAAKIQGHRDFAGVKKSCPSFNAIPEYSWIK